MLTLLLTRRGQLDEIVSEKANQNEETGDVDKAEVSLNISVTDEDVDLFFESLAEGPPPTKAQQSATEQGDSAESLSDDHEGEERVHRNIRRLQNQTETRKIGQGNEEKNLPSQQCRRKRGEIEL